MRMMHVMEDGMGGTVTRSWRQFISLSACWHVFSSPALRLHSHVSYPRLCENRNPLAFCFSHSAVTTLVSGLILISAELSRSTSETRFRASYSDFRQSLPPFPEREILRADRSFFFDLRNDWRLVARRLHEV